MEGFRRCTTILLTLAILAAVIESETEIVRRGKELSKIVPYNGSFYIADGNEVYKLNSRFDEVERANLSEHGSNDNTVTLILVDDKNNSLIVCGPFGVVCKCIHLDSLEEQFTSDDIVVQQNASHLQGIIIQKEEKSLLNLAVSLKHPEESLKMIEQFVIENHFQKAKNRYVQLKRPVQIDYRAVFQFGHHIFFFTNQQQTINDEVYISKISRVCKDGFFTFVDLQLRCNGYESYNLVQDAILINQKTLFVTFVEGQKTEEIQSDHGILCLADFEVINKTMTKEQKRVIDCENWDENTYLKNECLPNASANLAHIECDQGKRYYSSGKEPIKLDFFDKTSAKEGYITTLSKTQLERYDVILAGTANGFVLKFVLYGHNNQDHDKFTSIQMQKDVPTAVKSVVQIEKDLTFASTSLKVYKISSTNCSEFRSCEQTMKGKNPLCGWCVYFQSATRRYDCTYQNKMNNWLSALSKCPILRLEPTGIPVGISRSVTLSVEHIRLGNDALFCQVGGDKVSPVERQGQTMKCPIVGKTEHTEVSILLIVKHNSMDIPIANASFLFYNCSTFKRCGNCVGTAGASCTWKPYDGTCASQTDDGVNNVANCPRLESIASSRYIPSGVNTDLELKLENVKRIRGESNISDDITFHVDFQSRCSYSETGLLNCPINRMTNSKTDNFSIQVFYTVNSKMSKVYLDNPNTTDVIVYNCSVLSQGKCNYCNALKSDYECHWPSTEKGCVYGQKVNLGYTCPPPEITRILPRDGYYGSGTVITVEGNEFGTEKDIILYAPNPGTPVVVKKRCVKDTFQSNNVRGIGDPDDFKIRIRESFQCKLGDFSKDNINETRFFIVNETIQSETAPNLVLPTWTNVVAVHSI
ncbi:plexin-A4-like [Mya arenaria]|uniref:plexin-A4-like n=1 Tax=Mya arenaria TaxID=6604 RepID=UPI0022E11E2C|nr:plexin-A4-like [Mya arenaria]